MLGKDGLFAVQDENAFRTARDGRRRSGASRFPEAFFFGKAASAAAPPFSRAKRHRTGPSLHAAGPGAKRPALHTKYQEGS